MGFTPDDQQPDQQPDALEIVAEIEGEIVEPSNAELYALLVEQNALLHRYIDVVEQVAVEIGPVLASLSKSPILRMLGVKSGE